MKEEVKEIDLFELLISFINFIRVNFKIMALIGIAGIILGLTYYFTKPVYYEYKIYGKSSSISPEVISITVQNFNKYLKINSIDSVKNQFFINSRLVGSIVNIKATHEDETNVIQFTLTCEQKFTENEVDTLISGILLNNTYIVDELKYKKQELQNNIKFINKQIENYSKLHSNLSQSSLGEGIIFSSKETPTSLFLKRNSYKYELKNLKPYTVQNFPKQPERPTSSIIIYIMAGFALPQFLFMLFMAIKHIRKLTIEYANKNLQVIKYSKSA